MTADFSKTQIDRLGDRLRMGNVSDEDLKLLENYRRSFTEVYEIIVGKIREVLRLDPTGRSLKSTTSIIDKLRRETIRLSQIQDIAGCRVTAPDIYSQDAYIVEISNLFDADGISFTLADRRINPSHGYRAVHIVAHVMDRNIEIQVRTELQHIWAELCEALADAFGPELKYGGGSSELRTILERASFEISELAALEKILGRARLRNDYPLAKIDFLQEKVDIDKLAIFEGLKEILNAIKERQ